MHITNLFQIRFISERAIFIITMLLLFPAVIVLLIQAFLDAPVIITEVTNKLMIKIAAY